MQSVRIKTSYDSDLDLNEELNKLGLNYRESFYDIEYDGRAFVGTYTEEDIKKLYMCSFVKDISIIATIDVSKCDKYVRDFLKTAKEADKFMITVTCKDFKDVDVNECTARKIEVLLAKENVIKVTKYNMADKKPEHKKLCKCLIDFLNTDGDKEVCVEFVCQLGAKETVEKNFLAYYDVKKTCKVRCNDPLYLVRKFTKEDLIKLAQEPFVVYIIQCLDGYYRCSCSNELTKHTKFDYYAKCFVDTAEQDETCVVSMYMGYDMQADITEEKIEHVFKEVGCTYREFLGDLDGATFVTGRYTVKELLRLEQVDCIQNISAIGEHCHYNGASDISNCSTKVKEFIMSGKEEDNMDINIVTNLYLATKQEAEKFVAENFKVYNRETHVRSEDKWIMQYEDVLPEIVDSYPLVLRCNYSPGKIERICLRQFVVSVTEAV